MSILKKAKSGKAKEIKDIDQKILKAQITNLELMKENYELNKEFIKIMGDMTDHMKNMSRSIKNLMSNINHLQVDKDGNKKGKKEMSYIG